MSRKCQGCRLTATMRAALHHIGLRILKGQIYSYIAIVGVSVISATMQVARRPFLLAGAAALVAA